MLCANQDNKIEYRMSEEEIRDGHVISKELVVAPEPVVEVTAKSEPEEDPGMDSTSEKESEDSLLT